MRLTPELIRLLEADLGKGYDPQRALDFLRSLQPENQGLPEAARLENLLQNPPKEDVLLQTIYETPFVRGDIVMAGKQTRKDHPLTSYHPIHFKKTYLEKMSRWETPTSHEENRTQMVWKHFQEEGHPHRVPLALGSSPEVFRSELLEAKSLGASTPVHNGPNPQEICDQIKAARKSFGGVAKLWEGLESLREAMKTLHDGGMLHHDAHRENLMLSTDPNGNITGHLIDFETTEEDERFGTLDWARAIREDCRHLIEEATLVRMCAKPGEITKNDTLLSNEVKLYANSNPKILAVRAILKKEQEKAGPSMT